LILLGFPLGGDKGSRTPDLVTASHATVLLYYTVL